MCNVYVMMCLYIYVCNNPVNVVIYVKISNLQNATGTMKDTIQ